MPQPDKIFRLMEKPLVLLRHLRGQGCKILLAQPHHQKGSGNGIVYLPVLVPQGTVQRHVDEKLNDKCYIVPGLGDAGDRLYGVID